MGYPEGCRYTKDHEWIKVEGGVAVIGITDFAQNELGEIVFADLPAKGKTVKAGDSMCVVESTKAASDVYAPISGTVVEVNTQLSSAPNTINTAPHTDGWMVKLEKFNQAEIDGLMSAAQYESHLSGK